jgi:hypothetical protein
MFAKVPSLFLIVWWVVIISTACVTGDTHNDSR